MHAIDRWIGEVDMAAPHFYMHSTAQARGGEHGERRRRGPDGLGVNGGPSRAVPRTDLDFDDAGTAQPGLGVAKVTASTHNKRPFRVKFSRDLRSETLESGRKAF